MNITLRQIRYFAATAETGQVSRAAELCNITQSSITLAINSLEETIGYKLFVRQSRGMQLTAQGERFLRHCQAILRTLEDAVEPDPDQPSEITGTIKLALTGTIAGYVFPPIWRKLRREFPQIRLDVTEVEYTDMETGLHDGTFDMAIMLMSNIQQSESFNYEELIRSPRRLWVSSRNPLVDQEEISLRDLENEDYIVPTMDEHESMIRRFWDKHDFRPNILFKSDTLEALRSMVANDLGIAILSDMVYRSLSLEGRRIVRRDLIEETPSSDVGVAWPRTTTLDLASETFLALLKSETAKTWEHA